MAFPISNGMKSLILSIFFSLTGVGIFVWVIQDVGPSNIVHAFSGFPWWGVFGVIGLTIVNFWIGVIRWQRILNYLGVRVSARALWGAWLAGFTFSYMTPISFVGGEAIRTGFLRSRLGVPAYKGFASIAIDKVIEGTIWIVVIVTGISFFLVVLGMPAIGLAQTVAIGGVVIFFATALIGIVYVAGFRQKRMVHRVLGMFGLQNSQGGVFLQDTEHEMLGFFHFSNRVLWESLLLSVAKNAVSWSRLVLIVFLLGKGIELWGGFIMLAFSYLGYSAPVPGGFGTFEVSQTIAFAGLGLGAESGIALVFLIRAAEMLLVLVGGFFLVRFGMEFLLDNVKRLVKW